MDGPEIEARATLAAALILARAVELPVLPRPGDRSEDGAARRLRELTNYLYQIITTPAPEA